MGTANLTLELTTAGGQDLNDFVRIELFNIQNSTRYQNNVNVARVITIQGIDATPFATYRVVLTPANYRTMQFFQNVADGQNVRVPPLMCPIDPKRVIDIDAPPFSRLDPRLQQVLNDSRIPRFVNANGFRTGPDLYDNVLAERLKACLLNIATKSGATRLGDGTTCLDHYKGIVRMEQDRLFIVTTADLFEETKASPLFQTADESLHDPMPGFRLVGSFKTLDRHGNLQLTFQRNAAGDYAADVDIDAAQGVEHIFEVLDNAITGPTDPYDIHDILIANADSHHGAIDPGYSFKFARAAAVR